jgi:NADPH-dependent ferric siderophore reductase
MADSDWAVEHEMDDEATFVVEPGSQRTLVELAPEARGGLPAVERLALAGKIAALPALMGALADSERALSVGAPDG